MDGLGINTGFLIAQLVNIVFLIVVVVVVFLVLRRFLGTLRGANRDALATLNKRLVSGEIDGGEYERLRALILDQPVTEKAKHGTLQLADDGELIPLDEASAVERHDQQQR